MAVHSPYRMARGTRPPTVGTAVDFGQLSYLLRLLVGLALGCLSARSAQISVSTVAAQAGGSATADVIFADEGSQVAGLQFDLEFDAGLTVAATGGAGSTNTGKSLGMASLAPGKTRFLVAGLNRNTIADGVLLSLKFSISPGAGVSYQLLHVANAEATTAEGNAISLSAVDGAISIDAPTPTVLTVVNGASFLPAITDGAWISILGTNLSTTARTWRPDEIVNGRLPSVLDGVRVTVSGLSAAIAYISPTQLNAQVPTTGRIGLIDVVVTNGFGTSLSARADMRRNSPGIFVFTPGGGRYPAALIARSDGGIDYLGPPGLFGAAIVTRPARPGEVLELYATGLGPTKPAVPPGQVFSGAAPIVDPVAVSIGGVPAPVAFAGLSGAGLYQLNVTVPNLPPGDQALTISVNGVASQPGVLVPVAP